MIVGVISDTHDNLNKIVSAVELFNAKSVWAVIHCGDFVAPFALLPFKNLKCTNLYAVLGNNDGEKAGLKTVAKDNGWELAVAPHSIELGGKKIGIMHEPDYLDSLLSQSQYDIIAYGHLHKPSIEKYKGTLLINPGEACGWVTGEATVATINLKTMESCLHSI